MQSFPIRDAQNHCRVLSDWSYNRLTPPPIVGPDRRPTMAFHVPIKETIMPSNQEYKGKGMKGRNYDELSGVGTSSAGKTGTTGNLNDGGRDGGIGTPDLGDSGNLQSAGGQPGGTPAQGRSRRSQGSQQDSDLASGPGDNAQRGDQGNLQSGNLDQGNQSQSDLGSGPGDNSQRGSRGGGNMQSGGQGSRSGRNRLTPDDLDTDESL